MIINIKTKEGQPPVMINIDHISYISLTKSKNQCKIVLQNGTIFHYDGDIKDITSQLNLISL
jgi:hypothetical protein